MKPHGRISNVSAIKLRLMFLWLLASLIMPPSRSYGQGQPPALAETTKALYGRDYELAVQLAEKHLHKYPKDVPVRVVLARAQLALGKLQEAFGELQKALAVEPKNIDALYYLSLVSKELSQREYQRLFSMAPDSARVHQLLAEAAQAAENTSKAEEEFQKVLEANPHSVEVATELAELKRSKSKFDEAIGFYMQAEKSGPLTYDVAYGLGACYTYKQDYPQAIEWLRKAVALAPDSTAGRFALGNALFQDGQTEAAIPDLKEALRLEPRMRQVYFLLGRAYSKLGRQEEARAAIKKLDELNRSEVPEQEKKPGADVAPKPEQQR
ncbi:MAG TPA: tetratricopeptide repeat protein [Candidatus Acidoferrum sp.]|nr:tetratricopeptide repeat protein [Candidatus Acidoferrum sp.]